MATNLAWTDLSLKQLDDYYSLQTSKEAIEYLSKYLNLTISNQKHAILLDFYSHNLRFSNENKLTPEQTSTFFSILKVTHTHCTASPFISFDEDYAFFKDLLLKHSINRPPYSVQIFTVNQIKLISEYVTNTYFRHYMMYKYVFTKKQMLDLKIQNFPRPGGEGGVVEGGGMVFSETLVEDIEPVIEVGHSGVDELGKEAIIELEQKQLLESTQQTDQQLPEIITKEQLMEELAFQPVQKVDSITPQVKATQDLRQFIIQNLTAKIEDLKVSLQNKMVSQEEMINLQLKKIEEGSFVKKDPSEEKVFKDTKKGNQKKK